MDKTEGGYTDISKTLLFFNTIVSVIVGYFSSSFLESYGIHRAIPTPMIFLMLVLSEGYYFAERKFLKAQRIQNESIRTYKQFVYLIIPFLAIISLSLLIYDDILTGTITLLFIIIFWIVYYLKLKEKIKAEGDDKTPILNRLEIWTIFIGAIIVSGVIYYASTILPN